MTIGELKTYIKGLQDGGEISSKEMLKKVLAAIGEVPTPPAITWTWTEPVRYWTATTSPMISFTAGDFVIGDQIGDIQTT